MIENCSVVLGQFSSRYISRDTACEKYFGNFLNFYRRCLWHVLRGGGGGGTSLYKPFRYLPPQRVFAPFWSGIGYSFKGSYGGV